MQHIKYYLVFLMVISWQKSAYATVYEFMHDGSVIEHVAKDYRTHKESYARTEQFNDKKAQNFKVIVEKYAKLYALPEDLLHAVIKVESDYNPSAVSHAGAEGLMQLMPATAKRFGVKDSFVPEDNIKGGAEYLSFLIKRFKGDQELVFAAYNAGEGAVDKYGGIPPYKETKNYIAKLNRILGHN